MNVGTTTEGIEGDRPSHERLGVAIERLSIELTNRCDKGCGFCYNNSRPGGDTLWTVPDVLALVSDCAAHGVRAVSFGGGEPLQYEGLHELLRRLEGTLFRSVTTNGLMLAERDVFDRLVAARPDKVHLSIHRPGSEAEVGRVIASVRELADAGIASGINLLVAASQLEAAARAARSIREAGIDNRRIVYLPQRGSDTPTPKQVAAVAVEPFQSMSCLTACGRSPRFFSLSWDRHVAWCSYTATRRPLASLSHAGLMSALTGLGLLNCADTSRTQPRPVAWVNAPTNAP